MSVVDNYIILPGVLDDNKLGEFNKKLRHYCSISHVVSGHDDPNFGFLRMSNCDCGGTKCLEGDIWAAAFNYMLTDDMRAALNSVEWDEPDKLMVLWRSDQEYHWSLFSWNEHPTSDGA